MEGGTLREAWIREESETGAGWPGRTGRRRVLERTSVGGGVVGSGTAEKTGVVTLDDAVEEGRDEIGFSDIGSTVCTLTGVTDEIEDR